MHQTLGAAARDFLVERHLATLTTLRADGSPHVVPVGFTYDEARGVVRVITFAGAVKAANTATGRRAAVCQIDGARWLTLEGPSRCAATTSRSRRLWPRTPRATGRPRCATIASCSRSTSTGSCATRG
jgi:hypothetical protein